MSIRAVNSLSHYTDWTIGHVHSGALGWVGFISFGALYCLVPRLWKRERLYSLRLVDWHFWLATIGIVLYVTAMWVSGIMQGLMWRDYDDLGFLATPSSRRVAAMHPYYVIRALGGAALPHRRADHGLQLLADDPRRLAHRASRWRAVCRAGRGGVGSERHARCVTRMHRAQRAAPAGR